MHGGDKGELISELLRSVSSICCMYFLWFYTAPLVSIACLWCNLLQVIARTVAEARHSGTWRYADCSDVCERRGSGNNWACGYCIHGQRAAAPTLEAVRRAVESCDHFAGFITHMSLAGGTGSGLGSYLTSHLRDDYPHCFIVNQVLSFCFVINTDCSSW